MDVLFYNLSMLDLKLITNNYEDTSKKLATRGFDVSTLETIKELSFKRSEVMTTMQTLEAERNNLSKQIGKVKSEGGDIEAIMSQVSEVKNKIEAIKEDEAKVNTSIKELLLSVPNIPNEKTPVGKDEAENVEISENANLGRGKITGVKPHHEIAIELDIVDFERAVKLSGTRF